MIEYSAYYSVIYAHHWRRQCTPLQYSCLENPRDGGAWRAAVYGVAQSRTRLKWLSSSSSSSTIFGIPIPQCQAESRGSEVKPLAQDTQPADGKTRILIQEALWLCPSSCLNLCIWYHGVAETLPNRNCSFLPSPHSSFSPSVLLSWSSLLLLLLSRFSRVRLYATP